MIHRSPYPDIQIPAEPLHDYVLARAAELGNKPALVDAPTGRTVTYADLARGVPRVAAGLAARGMRKGDVVCIDAPNLPEYALAFLGVAAAGGVNTTTNPLNTVEELASQLRDSGALFLITVPALLEKARAAAEGSEVREIFTFGQAEGATAFSDLLSSTGDPPAITFDTAEDLVAMPYSSGTTGLPKGVMLTHRNLVANIAQTKGTAKMQEDEVFIGVLPFFHIYGMTVILCMVLRSGGTVVTLPRFDLEGFLGAIDKYGVTTAYLVPPIVLALAKHPAVDRHDLSTLQWINSGAAPFGAALAQACTDRIGCLVGQGYGLTETSPVTHFNPRDPDRIKVETVGPAVPNTEFMIVDIGTTEPKGPGEEGEVWIRGPQVMKGYFRNPEATSRTLTSEGWLRTGDIGRVDEDGYLTIVDRAKELIKYKGFQVPPAELEAVLLAHPAVADAAVIGRPDAQAGEVPVGYVVLKGQATRTDILDWVAERVAPYKKLRDVEFRDAIPKSASGKILRRVLRDELRERAAPSP